MASGRDNGSRVQTLLGHFGHPASHLWNGEDAEEQEQVNNQQVGRLQIIANSREWDARTEVGIVDVNTQKGIRVLVNSDRNRSFVPNGYLHKLFESTTARSAAKLLSHLQFLMQKDSLGQDSFLIGPPGCLKRRIAMAFCELTGREVEFLSISQDTTVADIKQRREIKSGTATFEDSCAVRAAIHGRVLILEGVEKAERNVLSTLNNLLENREMSLEDGRFLTNPVRFDAMMKDHGKEHLEKRWKDDDVRLVRVSDKFRVICLGVPVPEYEGNPLDPPFRSRFQSRDIKDDGEDRCQSENLLVARLQSAKMALDAAAILSLDGVSSRALKRNSIPGEFERFALGLSNTFKQVLGRFAVACIFPTPHLPSTDPTHRHLMLEALERFGLLDDDKEAPYVETGPSPLEKQQQQQLKQRDDQVKTHELGAATPRTEYRDRVLGPRFTSRLGYRLDKLDRTSAEELRATFVTTSGPQDTLSLPIRTPPVAEDAQSGHKERGEFVEGVEYHDDLISQMIALYALSQSTSSTGGTNLVTLVGNRGAGKTCLVKRFASLMNVNIVFFPLHRDMTSQDLYMRRATLANGDTIWTPSPLLTACERGDLLVLDSVESIAPATLGTLCSLLTDREASLPDGTRIVANHQAKQLPGDRVVHPAFRVISVGRPAASDTGGRSRPAWLTSEVLSCFMPFLWVRSLSELEERQIVESLLPEAKQIGDVQRLLVLGQYLRTREDEESRSLSLSTRQLIRISRRICAVHHEGKSELANLIQHSCLWRFLPPIARTALEAAMSSCDIRAEVEHYYQQDVSLPPPQLTMFPPGEMRRVKGNGRLVIGELQIGDVVCPVLEPKDEHEKSLIPDTYFVENPRQTRILKGMMQDYLLGSHLLLLGNQGTGKNKLVDRLLHLLHLPREYIQLDRDTTVNALTSQPVVEDGVVRYEDSPLVKAARFGRILVVDEADKAPTHVTAILKSLLADGEMLLSDGRRLVSSSKTKSEKPSVDQEEVIVVHDEFRAIVLANRPGYPFLGNDLFRETGDIFAPHVVDNPDEESELAMLKEYAPHVPEETLRKLTVAFQDLRGLVNDGKLLYPYSTRELVNAVKHMEKFPRDGLAVTLQNVFDFDRYAVEDRKTISVLFERHGIPVSLSSKYKVKTGDVTPLPEPVLTETWKPTLPSVAPVVKISYVIHSLNWKTAQVMDKGATVKSFNQFPLTLSAQKVPLVRHEGRASIFEEQLFSFSLPTAEFTGHGVGVVGACAMKDMSIIVAANDAFNALRLYWVKSPSSMREFDVFDMAIPHFNFRDEYIPQVRRPAPSRCTMFAMPQDGQLGMFSHDDQCLFVIDLIHKSFRILAVDPAVFRIQQAASGAPVGLYAERMRTIVCTDLCAEFGVVIVYQQHSKVVLLHDLIGDVRITLVLPFPVDLLDPTSPLSFLIRSTQNDKSYVLRATGAISGSTSTSTAVVVAGTVRAGIVYTAFYLQPVDQNRMDVNNSGSDAGGVSTLHGLYSYISPHPILSSSEIKLDTNPIETRFLRSPGTVCQVIEGYAQVLAQHNEEPGVITSTTSEALLRSYLRTNLTKTSSDSIVAGTPLYVRGTSMMASMFVKRKTVASNNVGRLNLSGGYLGFENTGTLEVVDLQKNTLRVIQVTLPDTNRRSGSAILSEKFDPDGVQVHDDQEDEEDSISQDETQFVNSDESNSSGLRQRAPFLFLFQTIQGDILTLDRTGVGRVFQVDQDKLDKALESWKSMVGEKANDDDLDFDDGEEEDDEDEDVDDETGDDDGDEEEDDDGDEDEDDAEDGAEDQESEGQGKDGQQMPGGKGRRSSKKGKGSKKGGKAKSRRDGKKGGRKGGKPGGRSRRGSGGSPSRGGRPQRGEGQGQGQGQGGSGGSGSGGGGGGDMSLPEPGQFRGPRPLSARDREIAQARLDELKRLTRYFPDDKRIQGEMESLEERLEEADEAERLSKDGDDANTAATRKRIASLQQRLGRIETEIQNARRDGRNTSRLEAEAQQIRQLIGRLEQEVRDGMAGDGDGGEDGEGAGGKRGGGRGGRSGKEREMDEQARKQAKKLEKEAWKEVLEQLDANPQDAALYQRYKDSVASEIRELRATLDQMHAKKNERVWLRNKDVGDLDDRRLVDGLTGERNIYKRRGERPPDPFAFQENPKRLTFLFDVSSSMSRYSMDGRLERSLEAATMAMEAFKGYEHKFAWKFRGHSGSTDDVVFVESGKYPKDDASRLDVLRRMNAHAETCGSGDNTLDATKLAIREITKDEGDEYFCILFSDANIEQYSIKPQDLKALLDQDERVDVFIVFIGSMGQQAQRLRAELPQDKVFVTLSTSQIPAVLKKIFLSSVLKE